ncbi:hypothetical protein SKAU_G00209460 [Synaphobranchus kaupii]|uniref:DUF4371 domain-containing protein n=1 Tax=Synaphobranchus kaupii TaxID=118154 RepID=A0A9Q1F8F7_SYNKA|nr:hypothetical protein SKAU_G00209460 [Synaphobranchus kaupii]
MLKVKFFSLATDGSNGKDAQLYPVVVRYFNEEVGRIVTQLLALPACEEIQSTGENIFKTVDTVLQSFNVPWKNCIAFGTDNAAVMMGVHKGVVSFIKKQNAAIHIQGCPCHLIHIAAQNAASKLPSRIDEFLIDIYYYLEKSSKRQKQLQQCQDLCGTQIRKILKHVNTRLLDQWPALMEFSKVRARLGKNPGMRHKPT